MKTKNKNLYYILGGVVVLGVVALVAMQLRGSSSLQGNFGGVLPGGKPPRSTVGTAKPNTLTPNPVATNSSPNVVADLRKPPVVNIITNPLPSGQAQLGDKFTVATLIYQGDLALDHVEVYVNEKMVSTQKINPVNQLTYTYNVDLTALVDGTYSLRVIAYDNVGHHAEKKIAFTVKHPVKKELPPHLTVAIPNMVAPKVKGPGVIGSIDVDANKELVFRVNLDVVGIDTVKYYVDYDAVKNPDPINTVTSPPNPDFNWVSPVYAWANHDGIKTWHIYPNAFNPNPLKAKFPPEQPTPLECFPDPHAASCPHTIKIEGLSKGNVLFAKEIIINVWGPQVWGEMTQGAIYIDVQSIKDVQQVAEGTL
ncbi:MAG: hypothetical protein WC843_06665 [Candidatus Gracilibacteria bacterium]|jgi:hypothetical protein